MKQDMKTDIMDILRHIPVLAGAALLALSCSQESLPGDGAGEQVSGIAGEGRLSVTVTQGSFRSDSGDPLTKVAGDGLHVSFTEGDEIGIYIVKDAQIKHSNIRLSFDGSGWNVVPEGDEPDADDSSADEVQDWLPDEGDGAKYFAYYPYEADISEEFLAASAENAEEFFTSYIENRGLVKADYGYDSIQELYRTNAIMAGTGQISGNYISFPMEHQMACIVIEEPNYYATGSRDITEYHLSSDPDYKWQIVTSTEKIQSTLGTTFVSFYAFRKSNVDGTTTSTVIYKPGETITWSQINWVNGKFFPLNFKMPQKGECKTYVVSLDNITEVEHVLSVGDYFMKDGSLVAHGTELTEEQKANCVGIVFSTDPDRIGETEKTFLKDNYGNGGNYPAHGLVMALKNAATSTKICDYNPESDGFLFDFYKSWEDLYSFTSGMRTCRMVADADKVEHFLCIDKALDYGADVSRAKTTGWYLPAIGQLVDILQNLGGLAIEDGQEYDWMSQYEQPDMYYCYKYINSSENVLNALNGCMKGTECDIFTNDDDLASTSFGPSITYAAAVDLNPKENNSFTGNVVVNCYSDIVQHPLTVRSVLAF